VVGPIYGVRLTFEWTSVLGRARVRSWLADPTVTPGDPDPSDVLVTLRAKDVEYAGGAFVSATGTLYMSYRITTKTGRARCSRVGADSDCDTSVSKSRLGTSR